MSGSAIVAARLDADGLLLDGDAEFLALNAQAGGERGMLLAPPPLATVARLVRRLGIPVARRVRLADGEADLDCWVRARPDGHGIAISLSDMQERAATDRRQARVRVLPPGNADWTWETDAHLRLTMIDPRAADSGVDVAAMLAQPLERMFAADGETGDQIFAARVDMHGVPAKLQPRGTPVLLTALVRNDAAGGFAGYVGGVAVVRPSGEPALSETFVNQLDQALRPAIGRIIGRADAMNAQLEGPLDTQYIDYAADIASAGRHLLGLIDDLADLQAIERANFVVAAEPIDLADVARRAAGLLAVRAADAGVRIVRPEPDQSILATGEFRRTLQILVNLVGNAVRYSPRGAAVTVSVGRSGEQAVAIVADEGRGIATEDQARVFEKFVRIDTAEPGGSGLGLYIARRLARAMRGDLTLESVPGEGARFTLSLPAR